MTNDPLDQLLTRAFAAEIDKLADPEMVDRILCRIRRQQRRRDLLLSTMLTLGLAATLILVPFNFSFMSLWLTQGLDQLPAGGWLGALKSTAPLLVAAVLIPCLFAITDEAV
ncbi:MAG: hypothetical protein O3A63_00975 [Proteobacteria bacterium]|nr:hypothetical protein [Pseudomonadota bacterium]